MKFNDKEFKKFAKDFEKSVKDLTENEEVPIEKILNNKFMKTYTKFESVDDFFTSGGYNINSTEDLEQIPDEDLDKYVSSVSKFKTWEEMLGEASSDYLADKLKLL